MVSAARDGFARDMCHPGWQNEQELSALIAEVVAELSAAGNGLTVTAKQIAQSLLKHENFDQVADLTCKLLD